MYVLFIPSIFHKFWGFYHKIAFFPKQAPVRKNILRTTDRLLNKTKHNITRAWVFPQTQLASPIHLQPINNTDEFHWSKTVLHKGCLSSLKISVLDEVWLPLAIKYGHLSASSKSDAGVSSLVYWGFKTQAFVLSLEILNNKLILDL